MEKRKRFQSTLPARGATPTDVNTGFLSKYFNPRSPHGERRPPSARASSPKRFQSTLPARGATSRLGRGRRNGRLFQSTLPARGATDALAILIMRNIISIHAPRTGSDSTTATESVPPNHFNPRSPHGERRERRRTALQSAISIHAPRTGSDKEVNIYGAVYQHFNPRSPHGERLSNIRGFSAHDIISIHAPRTGSDCAK